MACVIAAPSSGSGKTLLSLVLASWAREKRFTLQAFKAGPDYLDSKQLSTYSQRSCRNLDLMLCGNDWVKESFQVYGSKADMVLVEGVMGLFDGIGASQKGSTAELANFLQLPIVLILDGRGQAASLAALVKGFRDHDPSLDFAGVVINNVKSQRHKELLANVLDSINMQSLGFIPYQKELELPSRYLGLIPPNENLPITDKINKFSTIAESFLDLDKFKILLKAPSKPKYSIQSNSKNIFKHPKSLQIPIAIAKDNSFHFHYQESEEHFEKLGMPIIPWKPLSDENIPEEAKGLIIPGGFPELYAEQLSKCKNSLLSLKKFYYRYPIYAECGGMLILGKSLSNAEGISYPMAGILPFDAKKGSLHVGYRNITAIKDSLILKRSSQLTGHEFHYWELTDISKGSHDFSIPWEIKGWGVGKRKEGWCNNFLHASWLHLHWPSSPEIISSWRSTLELNLTSN